jgi:hypothetical protein
MVRPIPGTRAGRLACCVQLLADLPDSGEGVALGGRSGPLGEAGAVVPAGVPGARLDPHLAAGRVRDEVLVDERRTDPAAAAGPSWSRNGW